MVVAFFGHAHFLKKQCLEDKIRTILDEVVGVNGADLFFGGYGEFDSFAFDCCKKYKESGKHISLYYVTPYITPEYQRSVLNFIKGAYDGIIYPEIEGAPLRYAISYRNKWIAERADVIIAGVDHRYGGAYAACKYAERKGKKIINILSDMFNK